MALALALTTGQNIDIRVASITMGVRRGILLIDSAVQRPIIDIAVVGVGVAVAGIGAGQLLDLHVLVTTVSMGVGGLSADQPTETETIYGEDGEVVTPGHSHGSGCYETTETTKEVLSCSESEAPGHSHSDSCYESQKQLTCSTSDLPAHSHGEVTSL